jgi:hypothetical protein
VPSDFLSEGARPSIRRRRRTLGVPVEQGLPIRIGWSPWSVGLPQVGLVILLVIPPAITRLVRNALNRRPAHLSSENRSGRHLLDKGSPIVIGRSSVRIRPRAPNRRSEGVSGVADWPRATGGHSFGRLGRVRIRAFQKTNLRPRRHFHPRNRIRLAGCWRPHQQGGPVVSERGFGSRHRLDLLRHPISWPVSCTLAMAPSRGEWSGKAEWMRFARWMHRRVRRRLRRHQSLTWLPPRAQPSRP